MPKLSISHADRLRSFTEVQLNGCWNWTKYVSHDGYGRFKMNGKQMEAHRAAYLLLVGTIADGMTLDHKCRNRRCVNPDHLEPVTGPVNTLRGESGPAQNARKTHCLRGHPFDELNTHIRARRKGRDCRACTNARAKLRRKESAA